MNIRLFDSTGNLFCGGELPFYDTDKLHTVDKRDADFIIAKALEINPKLFEQGFQVGVSPNNNTVYFYKHAPKAVNAFENKDMIFATCVQVCNTDGIVNRVCAIYCTPEEFEKKVLPRAIEGFEVEKLESYKNPKANDLNACSGNYKLKALDGIEKQDLSLAQGLEKVFHCIDKDERANEKNDWLIALQSFGCLKEERGYDDAIHLVPTTKPQYIYKAYQLLQDMTRNNPNIRNIKYDTDSGQITFEAYCVNSAIQKWRPMRMTVLNDHLEFHQMLIDTNSVIDKKALKSMLEEKDLGSIWGNDMGTSGDFTKGFYYWLFSTQRLEAYQESIEFKNGRREIGADGHSIIRLSDEEWAKKQAQMAQAETSTEQTEKPQKKSWFGKK